MNKYKIIISLFIILVLMLIFSNKSNAASASVSASSTNVEVGSKVTITTTIKGAAWQITLSGAVEEQYIDYTEDAEDATITKTATFTPSSAGDYVVKLSGNVTGANDGSSSKVSDSVSIHVKKAETDENSSDEQNQTDSSSSSETNDDSEEKDKKEEKKSSNANLSNLGIKPNDFSGFSPKKTSYDVEVPNDVDKVTVYATKAKDSSKATISGTGSKELKVGKNPLKVEVTAEDGTKNVYTINVTRKEEGATEENKNENSTENENTVENTVSEETTTNEEKAVVKKIEIAGFTLNPKFSPNIYEYRLNVNNDVSNLDIVTEGINENIKIEVAGNKDLVEGENIVTVLVYNEETKENLTYQIIVTKSNLNMEELNTNLEEATKKGSLAKYIIIGVVIFVVICAVVFIILRKKYKQELAIEDKYEYDEDDEDKVDSVDNHHIALEDDEDTESFHRVSNSFYKNTKKRNDSLSTKKEENQPIRRNADESVEVRNAILKSKLEKNTSSPNKIKARKLEERRERNDDEKEEFFRTSPSGRKGRHF